MRTTDDFLNLNFLQEKLYCGKEEHFSFPTQQILARSVKKRQSYRSSKSSSWETNLSRSPRERADLTAPSGLLFHPDNGSYAYIPTGRCGRSTKADSSCFFLRSDLHVHRALSVFALFGHMTKEPCAEI